MERESNIYTGTEAREALMRGVNAVADAAKVTLGAAGANAVLESGINPGHLVTNDGVSIVQMIKMKDPVENIGANLIKEIASRSDKESGDGTTTATVLAQAILQEGMKAEGSPMDIKRSLEECLPLIHASIDGQKKDITPDDVYQVALISGESEELAHMFQDIYKEIGKDGIVELDTSNLPNSFYEITEGVRLRGAGFLGAYSTTEPGKAVYKNPKILIVKDKISTTDDIEPVIKAVHQTGKGELVIFCDDIDMGVASKLAYTHLSGGFKTLIIKAPTLWKDWITEDFARITGATVVDSSAGISFKSLRMDHLGTCDKIITTKDETRVIGIKDVSEYVAELMAGTDEDKLRASWLQTKVATLKLGADSDSALAYLQLKAEDARNASYLALQDGVVAGGGIALLNASRTLPDTVGGQILRVALQAPTSQILKNAGHDVFNLDVEEDFGGTMGYDARNNTITDMWRVGIIDPARVVKNSVKNAISVAATVLTAQVVITIPKEEKHETTPQMPVM